MFLDFGIFELDFELKVFCDSSGLLEGVVTHKLLLGFFEY